MLGKRLRAARKAAGLAQGGVKNMRQGTVSKIENGHDVTLDTLVTYASSLGLEIALVPIGQAAVLEAKRSALQRLASSGQLPPAQLLAEFEHLKDPE